MLILPQVQTVWRDFEANYDTFGSLNAIHPILDLFTDNCFPLKWTKKYSQTIFSKFEETRWNQILDFFCFEFSDTWLPLFNPKHTRDNFWLNKIIFMHSLCFLFVVVSIKSILVSSLYWKRVYWVVVTVRIQTV